MSAKYRWHDAAVLLFVLVNLILIGADVALAHSHRLHDGGALWWPILASGVFLVATIVVVMPWLKAGHVESLGKTHRAVLRLSFIFAIAIGAIGTVYHLRSQELLGLTIERFIFTAPIIAPAMYTGLGILGLIFLDVTSRDLRHRLYWLSAAGGLLANAVLVVVDHAQNGFARPIELIAVAGTMAPVPLALWAGLAKPKTRASLLRPNLILAVTTILLGFVGLYVHFAALLDRFGWDMEAWQHGPAPFAPGLLIDIALFVVLLVWKGGMDQEPQTPDPAVDTTG